MPFCSETETSAAGRTGRRGDRGAETVARCSADVRPGRDGHQTAGGRVRAAGGAARRKRAEQRIPFRYVSRTGDITRLYYSVALSVRRERAGKPVGVRHDKRQGRQNPNVGRREDLGRGRRDIFRPATRRRRRHGRLFERQNRKCLSSTIRVTVTLAPSLLDALDGDYSRRRSRAVHFVRRDFFRKIRE